VHCSTVCHVWLSVFGSQSGSSGQATVTGSERVSVPSRGLAPGKLSVSLHVDDGPQISRKSRLLP